MIALSRSPNTEVGFTLIEVLAALVIVGLGMLAVIRAVNQTVNNTGYLREKTLAHWVAMNKLTDVRLSLATPPNGMTEGDSPMGGVTWHWRMNVTDFMPGVKSIEVKVAPKDAAPDVNTDTVASLYGTSLSPGTGASWDYSVGPPGGQQAPSPTPPNPRVPGSLPGPVN